MDWILRLFGYVSLYKINKEYNKQMTVAKNDIDEIHSKGFSYLLKKDNTNSEIQEYGSNLLSEKQKIMQKINLITDFKNTLI
jgi:hypothetical protein